MLIPSSMPRLKGFRFPRAIIAYAVWATIALRSARQMSRTCWRSVASSSVVRQSAFGSNRFGSHFAACIRRDRPRPNDKWTWMRL